MVLTACFAHVCVSFEFRTDAYTEPLVGYRSGSSGPSLLIAIKMYFEKRTLNILGAIAPLSIMRFTCVELYVSGLVVIYVYEIEIDNSLNSDRMTHTY